MKKICRHLIIDIILYLCLKNKKVFIKIVFIDK